MKPVVNVMRKVKKPRVQKPRVVASKPIKKPKFYFSGKNPYSTFYDINIEDVDTAIENYISTLDYIKNINEISAMRKIQTSLPLFLVLEFLKSLNPDNSPPVALQRFKELPRVKDALIEMNNILETRSLRGIVVESINKPVPDLESIINELKNRPAEPLAATKYLKKESLKSMSKEYLSRIAEREKIPNYETLTKKQLVSELMKVEEFTKRKDTFYESEILPICESTYKRAPWMRSFTSKPVSAIAVKGDSEYATNFKIDEDWYLAKSTFYKDACEIGRIFEPGKIAYYFKGDRSLTIETRDIYDASVSYTEAENDAVFRRRYSKTRVAAPRGRSVIAVELAPGLFSHLRTIFLGQVFICDSCKRSISEPPLYKSVDDDNKRVLFCSKYCFDLHLFGSTSSISSSSSTEN